MCGRRGAMGTYFKPISTKILNQNQIKLDNLNINVFHKQDFVTSLYPHVRQTHTR